MHTSLVYQDVINNSIPFEIHEHYTTVDNICLGCIIPYVLVHGTYARWHIFAGPISDPTDEHLQYNVAQESM